MARSLQQQIDDNDAAIERAETVQSYSMSDRSKQNALLATLYAERDKLRALNESTSSTSMATLACRMRAR